MDILDMDLFEVIVDDDQEIVNFMNYQRRVYTIRVRVDHMNMWDDVDFRARFRISKDVIQILEYINDQISSQTDR